MVKQKNKSNRVEEIHNSLEYKKALNSGNLVELDSKVGSHKYLMLKE